MGNNEIFSAYTEMEKRELLEYLRDYRLQLRDEIGLKKWIKFGIEIETESDEVYNLLTSPLYRHNQLACRLLMHSDDYFKSRKANSYSYEKGLWILKEDCTVKNGAEIHSPILTDTKKIWQELKEVCMYLSSLGARATDNTATHIHFAEQSFLTDVYDLYNLIKLYTVYEGVLYYFGTGEFVNFRERINEYSSPVAKDFQRACQGFYVSHLSYQKFLKKLDFSYNRGLRLNNLQSEYKSKKTFEFRFANGSLSPAIIQNLVNAEAKLCCYAISDDFDDDYITRKFKDAQFPKTVRELTSLYLNISLDDILEFADLIFDNTIDKLNFIKQCIKEPETSLKKGLQKAKKFY